MKKGIHPEVHKDAKAVCTSCNAVFLIPSTVKEISVENCRLCHPVYTGKKQGEARGGRIERFRKRMAAGHASPAKSAAGKETAVKGKGKSKK